MLTQIEWRARVTGQESVDDLLEFAGEVERGLKESQLVPDEAKVTEVISSFSHLPQVTLSWITDNEMENRDAVAS